MANEDWTEQEVEAAVSAYVEMLLKRNSGESFSKAEFNRNLRTTTIPNRTRGSIEFRMQNISAVLDEMGLKWIEGYTPARNVGPTVKKQIVSLVSKMKLSDETPTFDTKELEQKVNKLRKQIGCQTVIPPVGRGFAEKSTVTTVVFSRDPQIKAWVLESACGHCEGCKGRAPFNTREGFPFLEVHHVQLLSEGGADTIENTVALCPNCHRRIHYSEDQLAFKKELFLNVKRLSVK